MLGSACFSECTLYDVQEVAEEIIALGYSTTVQYHTYSSNAATEFASGCRLWYFCTYACSLKNEIVKCSARVESRAIDVRDSKRYLSLMLLTASGCKEYRCNKKEGLVKTNNALITLNKEKLTYNESQA